MRMIFVLFRRMPLFYKTCAKIFRSVMISATYFQLFQEKQQGGRKQMLQILVTGHDSHGG